MGVPGKVFRGCLSAVGGGGRVATRSFTSGGDYSRKVRQ